MPFGNCLAPLGGRCPEGTFENSPAFQRWVSPSYDPKSRRDGRARPERHASRARRIQPSLRDVCNTKLACPSPESFRGWAIVVASLRDEGPLVFPKGIGVSGEMSYITNLLRAALVACGMAMRRGALQPLHKRREEEIPNRWQPQPPRQSICQCPTIRFQPPARVKRTSDQQPTPRLRCRPATIRPVVLSKCP